MEVFGRVAGAGVAVREARDQYLGDNGFDVAGYTAPTFELEVFGRPVRFRNTRGRQRVVPLHDLHHVATGYGTDYVGEAEIGAWELRGGCPTLILWALNGAAVLIGLFLAPRRVVRAWRRAKGQRTLYRSGLGYDEALAMTVGALRAHLGLAAEGLVRGPVRLHGKAPGPPEGRAAA